MDYQVKVDNDDQEPYISFQASIRHSRVDLESTEIGANS